MSKGHGIMAQMERLKPVAIYDNTTGNTRCFIDTKKRFKTVAYGLKETVNYRCYL